MDDEPHGASAASASIFNPEVEGESKGLKSASSWAMLINECVI